MHILWLAVGVAGMFLLAWVAGLRQISRARRPRFTFFLSFWWGMPVFGFTLAITGFAFLIQWRPFWGVTILLLCSLLLALVLTHDQPSAQARILYDTYRQIKSGNPGADEFDYLYSLVSARFVNWSEDRRVELCAGKDIRQLILVLLLLENRINPLQDATLFEKIKKRLRKIIPDQPARNGS